MDYSKWDKIELSDDEDFECHPNVDKKSFIRWKQADIHQKRKEQQLLLTNLKTQKQQQKQLLDHLKSLQSLEINNVPEALKTLESLFPNEPFTALAKKTTDLNSLLTAITKECSHLENAISITQTNIEKEEKKANSKLTSDNICKPGFDRTVYTV
jgi:cell division cycle protein 37